MNPFHVLLAIFATLSLAGFVFLMRWERGIFQAKGLGRSWLVVRLWSLPTALITAAVVVIPARNTAGMESLAIFYLLLLFAAPVFWFGSHWFAGQFVTPPLTFAQSASIAASPLAFLLADAMLAHQLQSPAWSLLRALGLA